MTSSYFAGQADGTVYSLAGLDPGVALLGIPGGPYARIVADSISAHDHRVTTMCVKFAKRNQAELNTHAALNYNSASSRARPVKVVRAMTLSDPAWPLDFGSATTGMDSDLVNEVDQDAFLSTWWEGCVEACEQSARLEALRVSKEECNRPMEPYSWTEVVITATDWDGFFQQRAHPSASAHLRAAAYAMAAARDASTPVFLPHGSWHLPFVDDIFVAHFGLDAGLQRSAACCARVSYARHGVGTSNIADDLALYERLVVRAVDEWLSSPQHWSPLGHQCTPSPLGRNALGGLTGFDQHRHLVETRFHDDLYRSQTLRLIDSKTL